MIFFRKKLYLSPDGRIEVRRQSYGGAEVRMLLVDGTRESATFEKKSKRCEPVFDYIKTFAALLLIHPEFSETLLIGGAGCSLPKYLLMRFPGRRMEVVEKDALMVELANRYFYLKDAVQRYDPHRERLSVTVMDGYDYLCQIEKRYDVIFNDAFTGCVADARLSSEAGISLIQKRLKQNGMYVMNLVAEPDGTVRKRLETRLKKYFRTVQVQLLEPDRQRTEKQNIIVSASNEERKNGEDADTGLWLIETE